MSHCIWILREKASDNGRSLKTDHLTIRYLVGRSGVIQLGCPDPWNNQGGLAKVGACRSFLFTQSSLVVKIKNTWLILLSNRIIC